MNTEQMFKMGVTPIEGTLAGKRFRVLSIDPDMVSVQDWDEDSNRMTLRHGAYKLWEEPKTLFEDSSVEPTWGNLKKAMEAAGLPDDTRFVVPRTDWFLRGYGEPATFSIEPLRQPYEKPKKHVVVR